MAHHLQRYQNPSKAILTVMFVSLEISDIAIITEFVKIYYSKSLFQSSKEKTNPMIRLFLINEN